MLISGCAGSSSGKAAGQAAASGGAAKPIRLMFVAPISPAASLGGVAFPWGAKGAEAAAKAINASGGIAGHDVVIDTCDNKGDPNETVNCVRKAKNQGDIAYVGALDQPSEAQMFNALEAAKIPAVATLGTTKASLTSPMSFVIDPDSLASTFAVPSLWQKEGCKNVAFFAISGLAAGDFLNGLVKQSAAKIGAKITLINVAPGQPDVSAQVSEALSIHPDCASWLADNQTNVKLILGLRKGGYTGKYMTVQGALLAQSLPGLGAAGDGVMATSMAYLPNESQPLTVQYRNEMMALLPNPNDLQDNLNVFSQNSWSGVYLIKQALAGATSFTSAELLKRLPTMCSVDVGTVYPKIGFCAPATKTSLLPRLFNTETRYYIVKNGAYTPLDDQWHDFGQLVPTS